MEKFYFLLIVIFYSFAQGYSQNLCPDEQLFQYGQLNDTHFPSTGEVETPKADTKRTEVFYFWMRT